MWECNEDPSKGTLVSNLTSKGQPCPTSSGGQLHLSHLALPNQLHAQREKGSGLLWGWFGHLVYEGGWEREGPCNLKKSCGSGSVVMEPVNLTDNLVSGYRPRGVKCSPYGHTQLGFQPLEFTFLLPHHTLTLSVSVGICNVLIPYSLVVYLIKFQLPTCQHRYFSFPLSCLGPLK